MAFAKVNCGAQHTSAAIQSFSQPANELLT